MGRCPECALWNTIVSVDELKANCHTLIISRASDSYSEESVESQKSGIKEFDRVFSRGIIAGSVTLISGEPGVGKSTLLAQVIGGFADKKPEKSFLYVSGEENLPQITNRLRRLNVENMNLFLLAETNFDQVKEYIEKSKPVAIIIDSIQVMVTTQCNYSPGSVSLVKYVTEEIVDLAKRLDLTFIIIGQKTKDGSLAGPKHLEHMVDTVLSFENTHESQLKLLKVTKNRFGSTHEIGLLRMNQNGFEKSIHCPSKIKQEAKVGKVYAFKDHRGRYEFVEVEALVNEAYQVSGKRIAIGVDLNRLAMLVAIMEKYLSISFQQKDIYLKVISDTKIKTECLDLAIVVAILSSNLNRAPRLGTICFGELSLTGAVNSYLDQEPEIKLRELGFSNLLVNKEINLTSLKDMVFQSR